MKLLEKHYQTKNSPHTNRCVTRKKILCEIKNSSIYAESGNQTKKSFSKAICKQQVLQEDNRRTVSVCGNLKST